MSLKYCIEVNVYESYKYMQLSSQISKRFSHKFLLFCFLPSLKDPVNYPGCLVKYVKYISRLDFMGL